MKVHMECIDGFLSFSTEISGEILLILLLACLQEECEFH
jgi:hypothetical protein